MYLILETTTGRLVPAGTTVALARGPQQALLQFVTNQAAALLPGGAPIALKLYAPSDLASAVATFSTWAADPTNLLYTATLDPLATGLAWSQLPSFIGKIEYGNPAVVSGAFHVVLGGAVVLGQIPQPILVTQPTGPVIYTQHIGDFDGAVKTTQTEGFWRVKAPCQLLGLQLNCQDAPTGADLLVDVYKGGVAQTKVAKLTAGQKSEETTFGAPLALAIGDVVQFRPTQVGSTKPGTNLHVSGNIQLL